jgi:hypothetical protein
MKARFKHYQVDAPKYGGVKDIALLTEDEAKNELCDAMDLIAKLQFNAAKALDLCEKAGY